MQTPKIQQKTEVKNPLIASSPKSLPSVKELNIFSSIYFEDIPFWKIEIISLILYSSVIISIESAQHTSRCPLCHTPSSKKQSKYYRKPLEQPLGNYNCRLHLTVHRFFCWNPDCRHRIFCKRFDNHLQSYQRCVDKVNEQILFAGLEGGDSKGARSLNKSHIPIKRNSIIRRVLKLPLPTHDIVNIGIDDWAKCKGRKYGSIIIDNDTHKPLDLFNHKDSACASEALKGYINLKTISSDRADCF